ncbi:MAG TPA: DUF6220 domain-containing protein [Gaiellaceae bacterium]|nr:DUF6220 domain-containing protein [Gaiellaceae bacterium]
MTQIRRGAFWLYRILLPVYVLGVLVAFVLAGQAVFERMNDFDAHQGAGFLTAMAGSLLLFLLALISWRDRATVGLTFLLAVLGVIVQSVLATFEHPWVGAFHPLNGVVILGLSTHLMMRAWRGRLALPA